MPVYVYGCPDKTHPRQEVKHAIAANPVVVCAVCSCVMHRIPQATRFYMNPQQLLLDKMHDRYCALRARKGKRAN